jgi:hypothetical protein
MKQTVLLVILGSLNVTLIILILLYRHDIGLDEHDNGIEQQPSLKKGSATYNLATIQQLQQLFTTTQRAYTKIHSAMGIYTHTVQAMPKITTTLERLANSYAKLSYHDQAYTAHTAACSLDPVVLIRSYCSTIKTNNHAAHNLHNIVTRARIPYAAFYRNKRLALNKIRTIAYSTSCTRLRRAQNTSILD